MEANEYQDKCRLYYESPRELGPYSTILSMMSSVAEVSEILKECLDKKHGDISDMEQLKINVSIGDCLFQLTNLAADVGLSLNNVMMTNIRKHQLINDRIIADELAKNSTNRNTTKNIEDDI